MAAELKLQRRNGEGCEDGHSSTGCMAERFQVCVLFTVLEHLIVHKIFCFNSKTVLRFLEEHFVKFQKILLFQGCMHRFWETELLCSFLGFGQPKIEKKAVMKYVKI